MTTRRQLAVLQERAAGWAKEKKQLSGLVDAERVLKRVNGIAITRLTSADVVRHPLVARIVDAYDRAPSDVNKTARGVNKRPADVDESKDAAEEVAASSVKTRARSRNGS
jgi:phosphate starvation-inducible PhoH-like protein